MWKAVSGPFGGTNYVLDCGEFYLSYNPNTSGGPFEAIGDVLLGAKGKCAAETALVKDGNFYILNGDHREAYSALIDGGYEECKRYYDQHKVKYQSRWSSDRL